MTTASDREVLAALGTPGAELVGRGGEANVYALDQDRVVRVQHPGATRRATEHRLALLDAFAAGRDALPFAIPTILDVVEVAGRVAVVERRLPGVDGVTALGSDSVGRAALVRSHLDAADAISLLPCPWDGFGEVATDAALSASSFREWAAARAGASIAAARDADPGLVPTGLEPMALAEGLPDGERPVVVHLDAFLGNMLAEGDRITAVIDFGPTTIAGPRRLDPVVAIAYLDTEITPTATEADRAEARRWADERGLAPYVEPVRRWIAAYWLWAVEDRDLARWCQRVLRE